MARLETWMKVAWAGLVTAALATGCETGSMENEGTVTLAELEGETVETATATTTASSSSSSTAPTTESTVSTTSTTTVDTNATGEATSATNSLFPAEITGSIHWLHTNVSDWPVTATLSVNFSGSMINFPYSKSKEWPNVDGSVGNPWVIAQIDGQWYAATFEWLRPGQTSKPKSTVGGGNIKASPMSGDWAPQSGQRVGIMVSGLARTKLRNVEERTPVVMVTWP